MTRINGSYFPGRGSLIEEYWLRGYVDGRIEAGRTYPLDDGFWHHMVIRVLEHKGLTIPQATRDRIAGCTDHDVLKLWVDRAFSATDDPDVIFAPGD